MKTTIDQSECIGCGICSQVCPEGIEMLEGKAKIINQDAKCLQAAAEVCPVNIIKSG